MGCFLGCFGSSDDKKRKKQRYKAIPRANNNNNNKPRIQDILKVDASLELSIQEKPSNPFPESREKTEVPLSLKRQKKVTFDTNVTTYEPIQVYDSTESLLEKNEKGETFPKSEPDSVGVSIPNYRYGNCVESDDEIEDLDNEEDYDFDDDFEDDGYGYGLEDEEHYDDNIDDEGSVLTSMELKRNARDRNGHVPSVLNPVENLTQWNALKSNGSTRKPLTFNGQKENLNSGEPDNEKQEPKVDASLSNWLIASENITRNNKRVACYNTELEITTSL